MHIDDRPRLYELRRLKIKGQEHTLKTIKEIASKWEQVAVFLDFEQCTINNITRDNVSSCEKACEAMFEKWLQGNTSAQPVTWRKLIDVLPLVSYNVLAEELKKSLSK